MKSYYCVFAFLSAALVFAAGNSRAESIPGVVVTTSGVPPAGTVYFGQGLESEKLHGDIESTADGAFTLERKGPEERLWIAVAPQIERMALFSVPEAVSEPLRVVLDLREGDACGRVVDSAGNPVSRAHVSLRVTTAAGDTYQTSTFTINAQGYYVTEGSIPLGDGLKIEACLDGEPQVWTAPVAVTRYTMPANMPDLVVDAGVAASYAGRRAGGKPMPPSDETLAVYSGVARDTAGAPIPGVELRFLYDSGNVGVHVRHALTDEAGRWSRLLPVDMRGFQMDIEHPDYIGTRTSRRMPTPSLESMRDGSSVITLEKGRAIAGHVLAPDGAPVAGALVSTHVTFEEGPTCVATDANGYYRIGGLGAGTLEIGVLAKGFAAAAVPVSLPEATAPEDSAQMTLGPETTTLDITLDAGGTIRGRFVNDAKEPIADARLELDEWRVNRQHWLRTEIRSGADGSFVFENVPTTGSLRFYIGAKSYQHVSTEALVPRDEPYEITLYKPPHIEGTVVDAETGQPIRLFKLRQGFDRAGEAVSWNNCAGDKIVPTLTGSFSWEAENVILSWPQQDGIVFGVFAKGYVPAVTPPVRLGMPSEPVKVALVRGRRLAGTVVDAAGAPVQDAEVAFVDAQARLWIQDGRPQENGRFVDGLYMKTNRKGLFELLPCNTPGELLITHEKGYVLMDVEAVQPDATFTLTPWAAIQGVCYDGDHPAKDVSVSLRPLAKPKDARGGITWYAGSTSAEDGSFSLERVPAMPLVFGSYGPDFELSHTVLVTPKPGEALHVDLAKGESRVEGKAVWDMALTAGLPTDGDPIKIMALLDGSAQGDYTPHYSVLVEPDGAFKINAVPAGEYTLTVELHAPRPPMACGNGMTIARAELPVTVPEGAPLSLPEIRLEAPDGPKLGAPIPAFQTKTLAGEPFDLAGLKGKWVVLDFWASWCVPCREEGRKLKTLHGQYAADPRVAFVGATFDYDPRRAAGAAESAGYAWTQVEAGAWGQDNATAATFGIAFLPSIWVIDPDGIVRARDVTTEQAEAVLKAGLQKQ